MKEFSSGVVDYVNLRVNQLGLILGKRMAGITTMIITLVIVGGFVAMVLLLLTLAFVAWYGSKVGTYTQGFLIAAAAYLLIGLVLFLSRRKLITDPVVRMMSKRKAFLEIKELGEVVPVKRLSDLDKRIELTRMQLQHSELSMEKNLKEMGENLRPGRILNVIIDEVISSTSLAGNIITLILGYFLEKKKTRPQSKKKTRKPPAAKT